MVTLIRAFRTPSCEKALLAAWFLSVAVAGAAEVPRGSPDRDPLPRGAVARFGWARLHHGAWLKCLAFSPDGTMLASCGGQYGQRGDILLWDVVTGRLLRSLSGGQRGGAMVTFSPDGKTLVAAGQDRTITVFDVATGASTSRVKPGSHRGNWAQFSPDGSILAVADTSNLYLVDARTGKAVATVSRGSYCTFSRDGKLAAVTSTRDTKVGAQLWDVARRRMIRQMEGKDRRLNIPALSPDGSLLAAGCMYGTDRGSVLLWNTQTGKVVKRLAGQGSYAYWTAFSPDGRLLAATARTGVVRVWDVATGKVTKDLPVGDDRIEAVAFSPNGRLLVAGGYTGQIRVWNVADFSERYSEWGHRGPIVTAAASADGRVIVTAGQDGTARVWDGGSGRQVHKLTPPQGRVLSAAVAPDGEALATHSGGETVTFWNARTGRSERSANVGSQAGAFLAFTRDGGTLLALGTNGSVREIDRATGTVGVVQAGGRQSYTRLAVSDDLEVAASFDRSVIYAWELRTGRAIGAFGVEGVSYLYAIDVGPAGRLIAGDAGQKIALIELDSGKAARQIIVPNRRPGRGQTAFSPDGTILAVGGMDGTVSFWSVRSGEKLGERPGHRGYITVIRYLPDGKRLLTASSDSTAILWDLAGLKKPDGTAATGPDRKRLEAAWGDLASDNATKANEAVFALAAAGPAAVDVLAGRLQSVEVTEEDRVRELIEDLGDERYAVRERATRELSKLGPMAEPALRKAAGDSAGEEVRARAQMLLEAVDDPRQRSGQALRQLRAVYVLERIGSAEARALLAALAQGAPAATLTRRAAATLRRLDSTRP